MIRRLVFFTMVVWLTFGFSSARLPDVARAQSAAPHFVPSQFTCSPPAQPGLPGSWQTSAPREGSDFVTAGQSVTIGLRDKFGTPDEDYIVMATVFAPDGSTSAATAELTDSDWAYLQYPDNFSGAQNALPGVYTILWTVGPLNLACDGFVAH